MGVVGDVVGDVGMRCVWVRLAVEEVRASGVVHDTLVIYEHLWWGRLEDRDFIEMFGA